MVWGKVQRGAVPQRCCFFNRDNDLYLPSAEAGLNLVRYLGHLINKLFPLIEVLEYDLLAFKSTISQRITTDGNTVDSSR